MKTWWISLAAGAQPIENCGQGGREGPLCAVAHRAARRASARSTTTKCTTILTSHLGFSAGDMDLYSYAFENPVNWTDPFGLDVTVNFFPNAANGFGHVGIGVNTSDTVGYYPTNNRWCRVVGCSVKGVVVLDSNMGNHSGVSYIIKTTSDQ